MKEFEKRRDRFEFFDSFEDPLLNITYRLELPDFLSFCKVKGLPPSHFFLFHLLKSLSEIDNYKYRKYQGEVIQIEKIFGSYTVKNEENLFNYTRFDYIDDLSEFIKRSLESKKTAESSNRLINTGLELSESEVKNYVFITSLPWLDFSSIKHPVFNYKSADIPSVAWGKFTQTQHGISLPFSVQAHHGFVDGFHMYELGERLKISMCKSME